MGAFPRLFFWRFRLVPYFALACLTEILGLFGSCTFFFACCGLLMLLLSISLAT